MRDHLISLFTNLFATQNKTQGQGMLKASWLLIHPLYYDMHPV